MLVNMLKEQDGINERISRLHRIAMFLYILVFVHLSGEWRLPRLRFEIFLTLCAL